VFSVICILLCALQPKKKKNISRDAFGTRLGRVHMQKMDLSTLQTRKMKGLKRKVWPSEDLEQSRPTTSVTDSNPAAEKRRHTDADMETD